MHHTLSGLNTTQTIKLYYPGDHSDSLISRDVREALQTCR